MLEKYEIKELNVILGHDTRHISQNNVAHREQTHFEDPHCIRNMYGLINSKGC